MVGTKITRQRIENQIESTKITCPRVGQCKNNSPKGQMGGQLNGRHKNNSTKDGESNSKHENNSTKDGESNSKHENKLDQWLDSAKITRQRDGRMES